MMTESTQTLVLSNNVENSALLTCIKLKCEQKVKLNSLESLRIGSCLL